MKTQDRVMYVGSSGLALLALALYALLAPPLAKAQGNGCLYGGNYYGVGTCLACSTLGSEGELCYQVGSSYQWGACGSCTY